MSLDSHIPEINDKVRGCGELVLKNLKALVKIGLNPSIGIVVQKQNVTVADKIIDYFWPNITRYHFMNLMPTTRSIQNKDFLLVARSDLVRFWKKLKQKKKRYPNIMLSYPYDYRNLNFIKNYKKIKDSGCLAGLTSITITPELNVVACSIARDYVMGNLNKDDFHDIWLSKKAEEIRNKPYPLCMGDVNS